jgi:hypothetical protein
VLTKVLVRVAGEGLIVESSVVVTVEGLAKMVEVMVSRIVDVWTYVYS